MHASYMNFLIGNDFVLVPQYDDEYDEKALQQVQEMFPNAKSGAHARGGVRRRQHPLHHQQQPVGV
ncbi:MAG: agmatine deiminase family protein [Eggerthellaceae bacterium]